MFKVLIISIFLTMVNAETILPNKDCSLFVGMGITYLQKAENCKDHGCYLDNMSQGYNTLVESKQICDKEKIKIIDKILSDILDKVIKKENNESYIYKYNK